MASVFQEDMMAAKRVLVTGGGSGIGLAISKAFAGHGAHVVLLSRSEQRLQAACADIEADGGTASWVSADVRDKDAVEEAARMVAEDGPIDVLINGAAGNFPVPFSAMSANAWESVIDIVLNGTAHVTRAFAPHLQEGDGKSIINIVAGYAWTGAPAVAHSGAAKAGVLNLTRSLAVEWAPQVRVNAVSPGPIGDTEGMKRLAEELGLGETVIQGTPLGRLGRTDEVAQACLFLASPAASYVTGACLVVDGGQDAMGPFGGLWQAMKHGD